jgi:hypothetical protein
MIKHGSVSGPSDMRVVLNWGAWVVPDRSDSRK